MGPLGYSDYLYRTSIERVQRGRESRQLVNAVLQRAKISLERSHKIIRQDVTVERNWPAGSSPLAEPKTPARTPPSANLVETISGQTIEGEVVRLDGRHFIDCILTNCTLEYGGQAVILESTRFLGCRFLFKDRAAMTLQLLSCFGFVADRAPEYGLDLSAQAPSQRPN